jgi:predicted  nucleic acid-binding Zn-ribbon protein
MTPTNEITDPNWNDIFDRDKEIDRLRAALQATAQKSDSTELDELRAEIYIIRGRLRDLETSLSFKDMEIKSLQDKLVFVSFR